MIKLIHKGIKDPKEFTDQHAYNLMSMGNNGGWHPYGKKDEKALEKLFEDATKSDTDSGNTGTSQGEGETG